MGLFGNSNEKDFKNKFVDTLTLLANHSYGHRNASAHRVDASYNELKQIARRFHNPFNSYFKMFHQNTGVFGENTSIAKGIAIVQLATEAVFMYGVPLSTFAQNDIIKQAEGFCRSDEGRRKIIEIINPEDLLAYDKDEAVAFILESLPEEIKKRITQDEVDYILDIMYMVEDSTEEAIDEEEMFELIEKAVKKDKMDILDRIWQGEYESEDLRLLSIEREDVELIIEGEYEYNVSIGVYTDEDD